MHVSSERDSGSRICSPGLRHEVGQHDTRHRRRRRSRPRDVSDRVINSRYDLPRLPAHEYYMHPILREAFFPPLLSQHLQEETMTLLPKMPACGRYVKPDVPAGTTIPIPCGVGSRALSSAVTSHKKAEQEERQDDPLRN